MTIQFLGCIACGSLDRSGGPSCNCRLLSGLPVSSYHIPTHREYSQFRHSTPQVGESQCGSRFRIIVIPLSTSTIVLSTYCTGDFVSMRGKWGLLEGSGYTYFFHLRQDTGMANLEATGSLCCAMETAMGKPNSRFLFGFSWNLGFCTRP